MITTKGRYAVRFMIDLAENDAGHFIPLRDIAERQNISQKYLEIIARYLVSAGLIEGASGRSGGYRLSRKPDHYFVGEILEKCGEKLSPVSCLSGKINDCPRSSTCRTLSMWKEFSAMTHDFFYSKKLSELIGTPDALQ